MIFYTRQNLPPLQPNETRFRTSMWGTLISLLMFIVALAIGVGLFVYCYQASIVWGTILAALYCLSMWALCRILFRALLAIGSPANWLARIGSDGILLKYRSYLHDDSPAEDPVAVHLAWSEIATAQLQQEIHTHLDIDEKRRISRWFLGLRLNPKRVDVARIRAALEFEHQRKPADFVINDLQHALFEARKRNAGRSEIEGIKGRIAQEKRRYPGRRNRSRFVDRPLVFVAPDLLRMEWSHITPGRRRLRRLLDGHLAFEPDRVESFDAQRTMSTAHFEQQLTSLLARGDTIEAVRLVRARRNIGIAQAKAFIAAFQARHD